MKKENLEMWQSMTLTSMEACCISIRANLPASDEDMLVLEKNLL